jgi:hypothetical protein
MIVYKIDKQSHAKANSDIKDMATVLAAIPTTLQSLQDLMGQQSSTISSPSINNFRDELLDNIAQAVVLTTTISDDSQKLVSVSDQAGKHLSAIEEHFGAVLRNKTDQQPIQV